MKLSMLVWLAILTSTQAIMSQAQACPDQAAIHQLKAAEIVYLKARNVPTMSHALEDGAFNIEVTQAGDASDCSVTITYTLPETDIADANKILDTNPGKRIMLAGQGYQLPAAKQITALAKVNHPENTIAHTEILQSAPLGRNRASVELMYATLAQSRATIAPNALNTQPWPNELLEQQKTMCSSSYTSDKPIAEACNCRIESLSAQVSPRQLSYIQYLASDPYSSATGALSSYNTLSEQINFSCKLKRR